MMSAVGAWIGPPQSVACLLAGVDRGAAFPPVLCGCTTPTNASLCYFYAIAQSPVGY